MDDPRKQGPQQGPIDWSEFIKQAQQSGAGADFNKIKSRFSHLKKRTIIIAAVVLVLVLVVPSGHQYPKHRSVGLPRRYSGTCHVRAVRVPPDLPNRHG